MPIEAVTRIGRPSWSISSSRISRWKRSASRRASASGVSVDLSGEGLRSRYAAGPLTLALGAGAALQQVLAGGEEHALVGTFAAEASLPEDDEEPWHVVGRVVEAGESGPVVTVDGEVPEAPGWDHFAGPHIDR